MKKILSIFLVITMLLTTCFVTSVSAASFTDIEGHWAEDVIVIWSDYGVISGYEGKFSPDRNITRGEFAVILNKLMGYQVEGENVFSDLPDKFYKSPVLKLYKAGVMQGYDGLVNSEATLTREEASVMICRALGIETADVMNKSFLDEADISLWSKPYISAMVNKGLLVGFEGKLNPNSPITRAEVVQILNTAVHPILKSGTFENVNTDKILVINADGVTVKNSEITGKVIITQGVLDGKISFVDSKVENSVLIDNDKTAFVEFKNTQVADKEILNHNAVISDKKPQGGSSGGGGGGGGGSTSDPCEGGHTWNDGVITTPPTTEAEGVKTFTCTVCGKTKTEVIPATGTGDNTSGGSTTGGSTTGGSTTGGSTTGGSTTGGSTTGGSTTDDPCKTGHTWSEGVVTTPPTVETEGVMTYICKVCGTTKTEVIEKLPGGGGAGGYTPIKITVASVDANSGDEIVVPVSISENIGLTGLLLGLSYNADSLTLTGYERGEALGELDFTEPGKLEANPINFLWDGLDADNTEGCIVNLKFKVSDTAEAGDYTIDITVKNACDKDVEDITSRMKAEDGIISVTSGGPIGPEPWKQPIIVGNISANAGDEIEVPVTMPYNLGLTGLLLGLSYDADALTLIGYERGEGLGSLNFTEPGKIDANPINFLWDGVDADYTEGCILKLKFKVSATAKTGEYVIDITAKDACDVDVNDVTEGINVEDGTVSVTAKTPDTHEHVWGEGVVTLEPTIEAEGVKTYTCAGCGETKTETIPKLPGGGGSGGGGLTCITAKYVSAKAGEEIEVPVSISRNVGLTGLCLALGYDSEAMTLTGYRYGDALSNLDFTKPGNIEANPINFLWDGIDADSSNGEILTLIFKVSDTANVGEYLVDLTVKTACDQDIEDVETTVYDGKVVVTESKPVEPTNKPMIMVNGANAKPGDEVEVAVSIENNPGILGLVLSVEYGEDISLVSARSGEAFDGILDFTLPGKLNANPINFLWDGVVINEDDVKDGNILYLTFKVHEDAKEGDCEVNVFVKESLDNNVEEFKVFSTNGIVAISGKNPTEPTGVTVTFKVRGQEYCTIVLDEGATIGEYLPKAPVVEGCTFKGWQDLDGNPVTEETVVTTDMTVVPVLEITVNFYGGYGKYPEEYGNMTLTLDADGKINIKRSDIPEDVIPLPWTGYEKSVYMPEYYEDFDGKYELDAELWYEDNGELKLLDETVDITKSTDLYWLNNGIAINALGLVSVEVRYDDTSSVADSLKTFLARSIPLLKAAKEEKVAVYEEVTSTILGILEGAGLIDSNKFVNKLGLEAYFVDALTDVDVESVKNAINEDGSFEITAENAELLKAVHDELLTISFKEVLDIDSNSNMRAIVSLAGYDICENVFNNAVDSYCEGLLNSIFNVEKETVNSAFIPASLMMMFNPIDDIFVPVFNEAEEEVINLFDESIRYDENSYLQYVTEELDVFDELLTKVDDGNEERTGYQLKDLVTCFEYIMKLVIATDDAVLWYNDYADVDVDAAYFAAFAKIYAAFGRIGEMADIVEVKEKQPHLIDMALDCIRSMGDMFLSVQSILQNETTIQAELEKLVNSGKFDTVIDEFKNSSMSQKVDEKIVEDVVTLIKNIAENKLDEYKVETSGVTNIDKYEVMIGDKKFSVSRYLVF